MLVKLLIIAAVIVIIYLLAIMPKLTRNPGLKELDGWLYAHRGLHNNHSDAPENSLKAFQLAVHNHYGIELDVQLTKDKVPVIIHDYNLKRACGVDRKVSEFTYEELKQYRLFQSEEQIPTFEEVLRLVGGKVPLIVELKIPWSPGPTCEAVSKLLNDYQGIYCIESFNPFGLAWYRRHYPKVVRGQLSTDFIREKMEGSKFQFFLLKHLLFNFYTKPDFIAYQHVYRKGLSFTLCRKLYRIRTVAWTIRTEEEYAGNKTYYDLFIFENFLPSSKKDSSDTE